MIWRGDELNNNLTERSDAAFMETLRTVGESQDKVLRTAWRKKAIAMILRSWLDSLFVRSTRSKSRSARIRATRQSTTAMAVEQLEPRQLLASVTLFPAGFNTNGTVNMPEEANLADYPGSNPNPYNLDSNGHFLGSANSNGIPNTSGFSLPRGYIVATVSVFDDFTNGIYVGNMQITGGNTDNAFDVTYDSINKVNDIIVNNPYAVMAFLPYGGQQPGTGGSNIHPTFTLGLKATDTGNNSGTGSLTINLFEPQSTIIAPVIPQYGNGYVGTFGQYVGTQIYTNGGDASLIANNVVQTVTGNPVPLNNIQPNDGPAPPGSTSTTPGAGVNVFNVKQFAAAGTVVGKVAAYNEDFYQQSILTYSFPGQIPGRTINGVFVPAFSINSFTGVITVNDSAYLNVLARSNNAADQANGIFGNLGANPSAGAVSNYPGGFSDVVFAVKVRATNGAGVYSQTRVGGVTTDTWAYIRLLDTGLIPPDVSLATKSLTVAETAPNNLSIGFFDVVDGIRNYYTSNNSPGAVRIAQTAANIYPVNNPFAKAQPQQRFSYKIIGGNTPLPGQTSGPFSIDPDTGEVFIATANALQYSLINSYNLQIQVTSDNPNADSLRYFETTGATAMQNVLPLTSVATLRVNITPQILPVFITGNSGPNAGNPVTNAVDNFTIPEASANNLVVGSVTATSKSVGGPYGLGVLGYTITGGSPIVIGAASYDASLVFAVDSKTGIITVNNKTGLSNAKVLDFLNQQTISLTVTVEDRGNPATAATDAVTITLAKFDSTAPTVTDGSTTIPENQPVGQIVGQVVATAGQTDFPIASYSIIGGNTVTIGGVQVQAFSINNKGQIRVNNLEANDFDRFPVYTLVIQVTDEGGLTGTGTYVVNLTNVPEPIVMENQSVTIDEALPNSTFVYQMKTTDFDNVTGVADIKGFKINGGNTGGAFAIDQFGNVTVANSAALDVDKNPSFSLTVSVTQNGTPTLTTTATLTITLTAVHLPPIVSAQTFTIAEHSLAGTTVGKVTAAIHANIGAPLTYAITGGNTLGAFSINSTNGIITVTDPHLIDYAATPLHKFDLKITVTDSAATPLSTTITDTVMLTSQNAPHLTNQTLSFPEGAPTGTPVTTITTSTGIAPFTYSIVSGNINNAFTINAVTGAITVNNSAALNFLVTPTFTLKVLATDSHLPKLGDTATITINLTFVDDAPVLTLLETTPLVYTEGVTSLVQIPVTATIVPIDVDSANMGSATIQFTGNYQIGQDQLLYSKSVTSNITATWNATKGLLTLTGVDTKANYQAALRSVMYVNNSHNPSALPRTLSFTITDSNGPGNPILTSQIVTRQINVVPVNNPPILTALIPNGETIPVTTFTEGNAATPVNSTIVVSDVDSPTLKNATVTLLYAVPGDNDVLGFTANPVTMGNITVVSNLNGVLNLTSAGGTATVAQWQAALRAVTFFTKTAVAAPTTRAVTIVLDDGQAANQFSSPLLTAIQIIPVFPPVLSSNPTAYIGSFTEHDIPLAINPTITVSSPSKLALTTATITATAGTYVSTEDILGFINNPATMGNIAILSNANGTLTLVSAGATASLAQWQAALRAVTYGNNSLNPNTNTRSATFKVFSNSGVNSVSNGLFAITTVTATNDPPMLKDNLDTGSLAYTEYATPIPILPNVIASDPKNLNLVRAVVQITGNYNSLQDTLAFTPTGNIKGTWDPTTGTLTLTGADSAQNYTAALRSVTFFNQFDGPTAPPRTVTFNVYNNVTPTPSNTLTRTINITTAFGPPILSGIESTTLNVKLNDPFTPFPPISPAIVLSDFDTQTITGATIRITAGYNSAQDRLGFNVAGTNIRGMFDVTKGALVLSGNDTVANYQRALKSVKYYNISAPVGGLSRTIQFTVTDSNKLTSVPVQRNVILVTTNVPAKVSVNSAGLLTYRAGDPPTAIAPSATITDPDSPNMIGVQVKITAGYIVGQDSLLYSKVGNINSSFDAGLGILYLYNVDTIGNYQAALQSVRYVNLSKTPTASTKTIFFTASDGIAGSLPVTQNIAVIPTVNPLVLQTNVTTPLAYQPSLGSVAIAPGLVVTNSSNTNLQGATIQFAPFNFVAGKDVLSFANTPAISSSFDPNQGILTLIGSDTLANYRLALRSVLYAFSGTPTASSTKTVQFSVTDGTVTSNISTANIIVNP